LVWHYRRNTVKAYLKQQRGYGEAEALLKFKHPDHFNTLGASHWRGRIYGGDTVGVRFGGDVVYHGIFGTGLFQTIYRRPASMVAAMLMSIEWHLLYGFVFLLSLATSSLGLFNPIIWIALLMALTPIVLSIIAAMQAPMPKHRHWLTRPLIAYLHYRQPIARGWARYSVRLKAKVMGREATGYRRPGELPLDPSDPTTLRYWSHAHDRLPLLDKIKDETAKAGWRLRPDSGWHNWDLELYGSRYVGVFLTTATEKHDNGLLTRVRVQFRMSKFCQVLLFGATILSLLLLWHIPLEYSRPAVLIPLVWFAMYKVNRWRVVSPVLGLIDAAAEHAGYWPVPTNPVEKAK
jgi:hypothetical protein